MTSTRASKGGFTLIELLVVCALLGIVTVAITGAIIVGLQTTGAVDNRLVNSHDAQLVSVYLPSDLQSVGNNTGDVVTASGNTDCSGVANVVRLRWTVNELGTGNVTYVAAYAVVQSGSEWQLTRYECRR